MKTKSGIIKIFVLILLVAVMAAAFVACSPRGEDDSAYKTADSSDANKVVSVSKSKANTAIQESIENRDAYYAVTGDEEWFVLDFALDFDYNDYTTASTVTNTTMHLVVKANFHLTDNSKSELLLEAINSSGITVLGVYYLVNNLYVTYMDGVDGYEDYHYYMPELNLTALGQLLSTYAGQGNFDILKLLSSILGAKTQLNDFIKQFTGSDLSVLGMNIDDLVNFAGNILFDMKTASIESTADASQQIVNITLKANALLNLLVDASALSTFGISEISWTAFGLPNLDPLMYQFLGFNLETIRNKDWPQLDAKISTVSNMREITNVAGQTYSGYVLDGLRITVDAQTDEKHPIKEFDVEINIPAFNLRNSKTPLDINFTGKSLTTTGSTYSKGGLLNFQADASIEVSAGENSSFTLNDILGGMLDLGAVGDVPIRFEGNNAQNTTFYEFNLDLKVDLDLFDGAENRAELNFKYDAGGTGLKTFLSVYLIGDTIFLNTSGLTDERGDVFALPNLKIEGIDLTSLLFGNTGLLKVILPYLDPNYGVTEATPAEAPAGEEPAGGSNAAVHNAGTGLNVMAILHDICKFEKTFDENGVEQTHLLLPYLTEDEANTPLELYLSGKSLSTILGMFLDNVNLGIGGLRLSVPLSTTAYDNNEDSVLKLELNLTDDVSAKIKVNSLSWIARPEFTYDSLDEIEPLNEDGEIESDYTNVLANNTYNLSLGGKFTFATNSTEATGGSSIDLGNVLGGMLNGMLSNLLINIGVTSTASFEVSYEVVGNISIEMKDLLTNQMLDYLSLGGSQIAVYLYLGSGATRTLFLSLIYEGADDYLYLDLSRLTELKNEVSLFRILGDNLPSIKIKLGLADKLSIANPFKSLLATEEGAQSFVALAMAGEPYNASGNDILDLVGGMLDSLEVDDNTLRIVASAQLLGALMTFLGVDLNLPDTNVYFELKILDTQGEGFVTINASLLDDGGTEFVYANLKPITSLVVGVGVVPIRIDATSYTDFEELKGTLAVTLALSGEFTLKGSESYDGFGLSGILGDLLGDAVAEMLQLYVITADTDLDLTFELKANVNLSGLYTDAAGGLVFPNIGRSELSLEIFSNNEETHEATLLIGAYLKDNPLDAAGSVLYLYMDGIGIGNLVIEGVGDKLTELLYPTLSGGAAAPSAASSVALNNGSVNIGNLFHANAAVALAVNVTITPYGLVIGLAGDQLTSLVKELLGLSEPVVFGDANIELDTSDGLGISLNVNVETLDIGLGLNGLRVWFGPQANQHIITIPDGDWSNRGSLEDLLSSIHVSLAGTLFIRSDATVIESGAAVLDFSDLINGLLPADFLGGLSFDLYAELLGLTDFELNFTVDAYLNFNNLLLSTFRLRMVDGNDKVILSAMYQGYLNDAGEAEGDIYLYTTLFGISEEAATEEEIEYYKLSGIVGLLTPLISGTETTPSSAAGGLQAAGEVYTNLERYINLMSGHYGEMGVWLADGKIGIIVAEAALTSILGYLGLDLSAFFDNYNLTVQGELGAKPLSITLGANLTDRNAPEGYQGLNIGLSLGDLRVSSERADFIPQAGDYIEIDGFHSLGVDLTAQVSFNAEDVDVYFDDIVANLLNSSLLSSLSIDGTPFEGIGAALRFLGGYDGLLTMRVVAHLDLSNIKNLYLAMFVASNDGDATFAADGTLLSGDVLNIEVFGEVGGEGGITIYLDVKGDKYKISDVESIIGVFTPSDTTSQASSEPLSAYEQLYGLANASDQGNQLLAEVAIRIASDYAVGSAPIVVDVTSRAIYALILGLSGIDIEKYLADYPPSVEITLLGESLIGLSVGLRGLLDLSAQIDKPAIFFNPTTPLPPDAISSDGFKIVDKDSLKVKVSLSGTFDFAATTSTDNIIDLTSILGTYIPDGTDFGVLIELLESFDTQVNFELSAVLDIKKLISGDWSGIEGYLIINSVTSGRTLLQMYFIDGTIYLDLSAINCGKIKIDNFASFMGNIIGSFSNDNAEAVTPTEPSSAPQNADEVLSDAVVRAYLNIMIQQDNGITITAAESLFALLFTALNVSFSETYTTGEGTVAVRELSVIDVLGNLRLQLSALHEDNLLGLDIVVANYHIGLNLNKPVISANEPLLDAAHIFNETEYAEVSESSTDVYVRLEFAVGWNGVQGTQYDFTQLLLQMVDLDEIALMPVVELLSSFGESLTLRIEAKVHYGNLLRNGVLVPDLLDAGTLNIETLLKSAFAIKLINGNGDEVIALTYVDGTLYVDLEVLGISKFYIENAFEYVSDLIAPYLPAGEETPGGANPLGYALPLSAPTEDQLEIVARFVNIYVSPEKVAILLTTSALFGILDTFGLDISNIITEETLDSLVDLEVELDALSPDNLLELHLRLKDADDANKYLSLHGYIPRTMCLSLGKEEVDGYVIAPPSLTGYDKMDNAKLSFTATLALSYDLNDYTTDEIGNIYSQPLSGLLATLIADFAPIIGLDISGDQNGTVTARISANVALVELLNEITSNNITLRSIEALIELSFVQNGEEEITFLTITLYNGNVYVDMSALNGPKIVLKNLGGVIAGDVKLFSTLTQSASYSAPKSVAPNGPKNAVALDELIQIPVRVDLDNGLFVTLQKVAFNAVLSIFGLDNYDITSGDNAILARLSVTEGSPIDVDFNLSLNNRVDNSDVRVLAVGLNLRDIALRMAYLNIDTTFDKTEYVALNDFNVVYAETKFELRLATEGGAYSFTEIINSIVDTQSLLGRAIAPYLNLETLTESVIHVEVKAALNITDILGKLQAQIHIYIEDTDFDLLISYIGGTIYVDASKLDITKFKLAITDITELIAKFSAQETTPAAVAAYYGEMSENLSSPYGTLRNASRQIGNIARLVIDREDGILARIGEGVIFSVLQLVGVPDTMMDAIKNTVTPILTISADSNATLSIGIDIESRVENEDGSYANVSLGLSLVTKATHYALHNDVDNEIKLLSDIAAAEYKSYDELEVYLEFNISADIEMEEGILDLDSVLNLIIAGMSADLSILDTHRITLDINAKVGISLAKLLSFDNTDVREAIYAQLDINLFFYAYDESTAQYYIANPGDAQDLLTVYINDRGIYLEVELLDSQLDAHISSLNIGELLYDLLGVEDESTPSPVAETADRSQDNMEMLMPLASALQSYQNGQNAVGGNALNIILALGSKELAVEISVSLLSTVLEIVGLESADVYNVVNSIIDGGKVAVNYDEDFSIYLTINKDSAEIDGIRYAGYKTTLSLLHDTVVDLSGEEFTTFKTELSDQAFIDRTAGFAVFDLEEIKTAINSMSSGGGAGDLLDLIGDIGASIDLQISAELRKSLIDWTKLFSENSVDSYLYILIYEALSTASTIRLSFNANIGQIIQGKLDLDVMLTFMSGTDDDVKELLTIAVRGQGLYGEGANDLTLIVYAPESTIPYFYLNGSSIETLIGINYNTFINNLLESLGLVENTPSGGPQSAPSASVLPQNALLGDETGFKVGGINLNGILDSLAFSKGKIAIVMAANILEQLLELLFGFPFEEIDELSVALDSIDNSLQIKLSLASIDNYYLNGDENAEFFALDTTQYSYEFGSVKGKYQQINGTNYRLTEDASAYSGAYDSVAHSFVFGTDTYLLVADGKYYLNGSVSADFFTLDLVAQTWSHGTESGILTLVGDVLSLYRQHDVVLNADQLIVGANVYRRVVSAFSFSLGLANIDIRLGGMDFFSNNYFHGDETLPLDNFNNLVDVKLSTEINSQLIIDDQLISYFDLSETVSSLVEGLNVVLRSGEKLHIVMDISIKLYIDFGDLQNIGLQLALASGGKQFINVMYVGDLGSNAAIYVDLSGLGLPAVSLSGINLGRIVKDLVSSMVSSEEGVSNAAYSMLSGTLEYASAVTVPNTGEVITTSAPQPATDKVELDATALQFGTAMILLAMSNQQFTLAITGAMVSTLIHGLLVSTNEGGLIHVDATGDGEAEYIMLLVDNDLDGKSIYIRRGDQIIKESFTPEESGDWTLAATAALRAFDFYTFGYTEATGEINFTLLSNRREYSVATATYWNIADDEARAKLQTADTSSSEIKLPTFNTLTVGYIDNSEKLTNLDTDNDGSVDFRVLYAQISDRNGDAYIYINNAANGNQFSFKLTDGYNANKLRDFGLASVVYDALDSNIVLTTLGGTVSSFSAPAPIICTAAEAYRIISMPDRLAGLTLTLDEEESFRISYTFLDSSFELGPDITSPIDPTKTILGERADYIAAVDIIQDVYVSLNLEVRLKTYNSNGGKSEQVEALEALVENLLGMPVGSFDLALQDNSLVLSIALEAKIDLANPANTQLALTIYYGDTMIIGVYYACAEGNDTPEVYVDLTGAGLFQAAVTGVQLAGLISNLLADFLGEDGIDVGELIDGILPTSAPSSAPAEEIALMSFDGSAFAPQNAADNDVATIEIIFTNQQLIIVPNMAVLRKFVDIEIPDFIETRISINLFEGLNNLSVNVNIDKFSNNLQLYVPTGGGLSLGINSGNTVTLPAGFEDYGGVNGLSLTSSGISVGTRGLVNSLFDSLYVEDLKIILEKRNSYWARTDAGFYMNGYKYPQLGPVENPINSASAVGGIFGSIWGDDKYVDFRSLSDDLTDGTDVTSKRSVISLNRTQENKLEISILLGTGDSLYVRIKNNRIGFRLPSFTLHFRYEITKGIGINIPINIGAILDTVYPNDIEVYTLIMNNLIAENRTAGVAANVGSVYGRVLDQDGNAVTDATVDIAASGQMEQAKYTTKTDGDGYYAFAGISEGFYEMLFSKVGYYQVSYDNVEITATSYSAAKRLDTELFGDSGYTPYPLVTVSGYVTDEDGNAIAGADVSIDSSYAATTDVDGHYQVTLTDVFGRTHIVSVYKSGWVSTGSQSFTITDGAAANDFIIDFVLEKSIFNNTIITGRLVDNKGNPLAHTATQLWITQVTFDGTVYADKTLTQDGTSNFLTSYSNGTIKPINFFDGTYTVNSDVNGNFTLYIDNALVSEVAAVAADGAARLKFKFRSEEYNNQNSGIIIIEEGAYNDIGVFTFTARDPHWSDTLYKNESLILGMRLRFGADKEDTEASSATNHELTGDSWLDTENGSYNYADNKIYLEIWFNSQKVTDLITGLIGKLTELLTALPTVTPDARLNTIDLVPLDSTSAETGIPYYAEDVYSGTDVVTQGDITVMDYRFDNVTEYARSLQGYNTKLHAAAVAGLLGPIISNLLGGIPGWIRGLLGSAISSVIGTALSGVGDKIASVLPLTMPHNLYQDLELALDGNTSVFDRQLYNNYNATTDFFETETRSNTSILRTQTVFGDADYANYTLAYVGFHTETYRTNYTYGWFETDGTVHYEEITSKTDGAWVVNETAGVVTRNGVAAYNILDHNGQKRLVSTQPVVTINADNTFNKDGVWFKINGAEIRVSLDPNPDVQNGVFDNVCHTMSQRIMFRGQECYILNMSNESYIMASNGMYLLMGYIDFVKSEIKIQLSDRKALVRQGLTAADGTTTTRTFNFNDRSTYAKITLDTNSEVGLLKQISLFVNGVLYAGEQGESTTLGYGISGGYMTDNFTGQGFYVNGSGLEKVVTVDRTGNGITSVNADGYAYYTGNKTDDNGAVFALGVDYVNYWSRKSSVETYIVIEDKDEAGNLLYQFYVLAHEVSPKQDAYMELVIANNGISLRSSTANPGGEEDTGYFNMNASLAKTNYTPPYKIIFNDPYDPSDFTFFGGTWANSVGGERTNQDKTKTIYNFLPERYYSDFTNGDSSESNGVAMFWSYDGVSFNAEGGNYFVVGYCLNQLIEIECEVKPRVVNPLESDVLTNLPAIDPFNFNEEAYINSLPTMFFEPSSTRYDDTGSLYNIEGTYIFNNLSWDLSDTVIDYKGSTDQTILLTYGIKGNANMSYESALTTIAVPVKVLNRTITGIRGDVENSVAGITTTTDGIGVSFDPYIQDNPVAALNAVTRVWVTTIEGEEVERDVIGVSTLSMWNYDNDTDTGKDYEVEFIFRDDARVSQRVKVNVHINSKEIVSTDISDITVDARTIRPYASATAQGSIYDRDTGLVLSNTVRTTFADGTTRTDTEGTDFVWAVYRKDDAGKTLYLKENFADVFTALESATYVLGIYSIDNRGNLTLNNEYENAAYFTELNVSKAELSSIGNLTINPSVTLSLPDTRTANFNNDTVSFNVKVSWSLGTDDILYSFNGGVYISSVTVSGALFEEQTIDNILVNVSRITIDSFDLGVYSPINPYNAETELGALLSASTNELRILNNPERITTDSYDVVSFSIVSGNDLDVSGTTMRVAVLIGNKGYDARNNNIWTQTVYQNVNKIDVSTATLYSVYTDTYTNTETTYSAVGAVQISNVFNGKLPTYLALSDGGVQFGIVYDYETISGVAPLYRQGSYTIKISPRNFAGATKTLTVNVVNPLSEISTAAESVSFNSSVLSYSAAEGKYVASFAALGFRPNSLPATATVNFDYDTGEVGYVKNSDPSRLNGILSGTMPVEWKLATSGDVVVDSGTATVLELIAVIGEPTFGYIEIPVQVTLTAVGEADVASTGLEGRVLRIDPYDATNRVQATTFTLAGGRSYAATLIYSDAANYPVAGVVSNIKTNLSYQGSNGIIAAEPIALSQINTFLNGTLTIYYVTQADVRISQKVAVNIQEEIVGTVYSPIDFSSITAATVVFQNAETTVTDIVWPDVSNIRYRVQGGVYYVDGIIYQGIVGLEQTISVKVTVKEAFVESIYKVLVNNVRGEQITSVTVDPYEGFVNLEEKVYIKFYGLDGYYIFNADWKVDHIERTMSVTGGQSYAATDDMAAQFLLYLTDANGERYGEQNFPIAVTIIDRSVLSEEESIGIEFSRTEGLRTEADWLDLDTGSAETGVTAPTYDGASNTFTLSMSVNPYAPITGVKYSEDINSDAFYYFRAARIKVRDGVGFKYLTFELGQDLISYNIYDAATGLPTNLTNLYTGRSVVVEMTLNGSAVTDEDGNYVLARDARITVVINVNILDMSYAATVEGFSDEYLVDMYGEYFSDTYAGYGGERGAYLPYNAVTAGGLSLKSILTDGYIGNISIRTNGNVTYTAENISLDTSAANVNFGGSEGYLYLSMGNEFGGMQRVTITLNYLNRTVTELFDRNATTNYYVGQSAIESFGLMDTSIAKITSGGNGYQAFVLDPFMTYTLNYFPTVSNYIAFADGTVLNTGISLYWDTSKLTIDYYGGIFNVTATFSEGDTAQSIVYRLYVLRRKVVSATSAIDQSVFSNLIKPGVGPIKAYDYLGIGNVSEALSAALFNAGDFTVSFTEGCAITYTLDGKSTTGISASNTLLGGRNVSSYLTLEDQTLSMNFSLDSARGLNSDGDDVRFLITLPGYGLGRSGRQTVALYMPSVAQKIYNIEAFENGSYYSMENYFGAALAENVGAMTYVGGKFTVEKPYYFIEQNGMKLPDRIRFHVRDLDGNEQGAYTILATWNNTSGNVMKVAYDATKLDVGFNVNLDNQYYGFEIDVVPYILEVGSDGVLFDSGSYLYGKDDVILLPTTTDRIVSLNGLRSKVAFVGLSNGQATENYGYTIRFANGQTWTFQGINGGGTARNNLNKWYFGGVRFGAAATQYAVMTLGGKGGQEIRWAIRTTTKKWVNSSIQSVIVETAGSSTSAVNFTSIGGSAGVLPVAFRQYSDLYFASRGNTNYQPYDIPVTYTAVNRVTLTLTGGQYRVTTASNAVTPTPEVNYTSAEQPDSTISVIAWSATTYRAYPEPTRSVGGQIYICYVPSSAAIDHSTSDTYLHNPSRSGSCYTEYAPESDGWTYPSGMSTSATVSEGGTNPNENEMYYIDSEFGYQNDVPIINIEQNTRFDSASLPLFDAIEGGNRLVYMLDWNSATVYYTDNKDADWFYTVDTTGTTPVRTLQFYRAGQGTGGTVQGGIYGIDTSVRGRRYTIEVSAFGKQGELYKVYVALTIV